MEMINFYFYLKTKSMYLKQRKTCLKKPDLAEAPTTIFSMVVFAAYSIMAFATSVSSNTTSLH